MTEINVSSTAPGNAPVSTATCVDKMCVCVFVCVCVCARTCACV